MAPPALTVRFSPLGGIHAAILDRIHAATLTIHVQAYELTAPRIIAALKSAKARGVAVSIIVDASNTRRHSNLYSVLVPTGIPIAVDERHHIAHDKVLILDAFTVITGSANFTNVAEYRNAENIVIIDHLPTTALYTANWLRHFAHSTKLVA